MPFRGDCGHLERRLRKADGSTNRGLFGRAVRLLEEDEYELIVRLGLGEVWEETVAAGSGPSAGPGLAEPLAPFHRSVIETLVRRPLRDRAFARRVLAAYGERCAVTGLLLRNGRGRPERQAAHIRPVARGGPDSVCNGLASNGTVHWMFDCGLFTLDEDHRLVLSRHATVPAATKALLRPGRRIHLPERPAARPHPRSLAYHREHLFLG